MITAYLIICIVLNFCWLFMAGMMQLEGDFADNAADGFFYWLIGAVAIFLWPLIIAGAILIGPFFLWTQTSWHQDRVKRKAEKVKLEQLDEKLHKTLKVFDYPQDKV